MLFTAKEKLYTLFCRRYTCFDYNKSFIALVYKMIDIFRISRYIDKNRLIANNKTLEILEIDFQYLVIILSNYSPRCYNYNLQTIILI